MRTILLLLAILLAPMATAASMTVGYDIGEDRATVTHQIVMEDERITLRLPPDYDGLHLDGRPVSAQDTITLVGSGTHYVRYDTASVLEGGRHIIIDLSRQNVSIEDVNVQLPTGATLESSLRSDDPSVHPLPTSTRSDGERHVLSWTGESIEPSRAILITYDTDGSGALMVVGALLLAVLAAAAALAARRTLARTDELTRNLYGDEKDLVRILDRNGGEMWQKKLTQESGLSKVKISRRMRSLEAKGVIEKIPHGNTNRIRLK